MSNGCLLCGDLTRAGEIVFQDDTCAVLLHPDRAVAGHAMIVARRHVENFADLLPKERERFSAVHAAAERALIEKTGADRAILLKLGIAVPHLHLHIYPVAATLDRQAVMQIIDGKVSEERGSDFATEVRRLLTAHLP